MYINYFRDGKPASKLFEVIADKDLEKIGNAIECYNAVWGEERLVCEYQYRKDRVITSFFNIDEKRYEGFPLLNEFAVYKTNSYLSKTILANTAGVKIILDAEGYYKMMPRLKHLPKTIDEYIRLISIDPRYLLSVDVGMLVHGIEQDKELLTKIRKVKELSMAKSISTDEDMELIDKLAEYKLRDAYKKEVEELERMLIKKIKRYIRQNHIKLEQNLTL